MSVLPSKLLVQTMPAIHRGLAGDKSQNRQDGEQDSAVNRCKITEREAQEAPGIQIIEEKRKRQYDNAWYEQMRDELQLGPPPIRSPLPASTCLQVPIPRFAAPLRDIPPKQLAVRKP